MTAQSLDATPRPAWRTRAWGIAGALSITETASWGIPYYAFAAFLVPMQHELGYSAAQLTGAFSLALAVSALASFIFLPLSQLLIDTQEWRAALLILAAVTIPLHGLL